ncbi:MAG: PrsW family intramembrane metalloprotease [Chloroflexota bacterium]|nr:PrsW family intramembrane metalloprotease [Chloroflexota bacterium]
MDERAESGAGGSHRADPPAGEGGGLARRFLGCGCLGCAGLFFLFGMSLLLVSAVPNPVALTIAAVAAVLPVPAYVFAVLQLDRFETEPWQVLTVTFLWGALVATFFSAILNSLIGAIITVAVGETLGEVITAGAVAPVVEETSKGAAIILLLVILRSEFDNVLDGIVYGSLIGLGFAMTENILYFGRVYQDEGIVGLGVLFYLRILLGGFGHALYTGTTGAAVGFAREAGNWFVKAIVPPIGYALAVFQHAAWNFLGATLIPALLPADLDPLVLLFVVMPIISVGLTGPGILVLLGIAVLAWRREAQVIRTFLADEVAAGVITPAEYAILPSLRARFRDEARALRRQGIRAFLATRSFHLAATELAFRKWHLSRGERPKRAQKVTPEDRYRQQLASLRARMTV